MDLHEIFMRLDSGESGTLLEAISCMNLFDIGQEIPLGYGFSITINPSKDAVLELAKTDEQLFILNKLYTCGGALRVTLKWLEFPLCVEAIIYFNFRLGLVVFLDAFNTGLPSDKLSALEFGFTDLVSFNRHNRDFHMVAMNAMEDWFNRVYYTGIMENGKDVNFIGNIIRW